MVLTTLKVASLDSPGPFRLLKGHHSPLLPPAGGDS